MSYRPISHKHSCAVEFPIDQVVFLLWPPLSSRVLSTPFSLHTPVCFPHPLVHPCTPGPLTWRILNVHVHLFPLVFRTHEYKKGKSQKTSMFSEVERLVHPLPLMDSTLPCRRSTYNTPFPIHIDLSSTPCTPHSPDDVFLAHIQKNRVSHFLCICREIPSLWKYIHPKNTTPGVLWRKDPLLFWKCQKNMLVRAPML